MTENMSNIYGVIHVQINEALEMTFYTRLPELKKINFYEQ